MTERLIVSGVAAWLALAVPAWPALATEASALPLHNPFKRPLQAVSSGAVQGSEGVPPAEPPAPRLVLKGLLLAGPDTVVNINDVMLRIGERIEGYRLLAIEGTRAVLDKGGKRLVLDIENRD
jgi:hypothetical protein